MAIQVSYNPKKSTETWERESTALIKLSKVLDCKRLIILTYELEEEIVVKVKVVSFRQMYHAEVVSFRQMYHAGGIFSPNVPCCGIFLQNVPC